MPTMTETFFTIDQSRLSFETHEFPFLIDSFPKPYEISIITSESAYHDVLVDADIIIIDSNVATKYPPKTSLSTSILIIQATEANKCMNTVLQIIDNFTEKNISKGSKVVAVGGGIIQDLAAAACALFRRGQPFIYLPTTTLGQLDSCVGAKCALNTDQAKNILGLFSAPQRVLIPMFMIQSMPLKDHRAGLAEMLRLCFTASWEAVKQYISYFPHICDPNTINLIDYAKALSLSLSIKKAVVDYDEFELNVRRSMNFGHTFGHAVEKLSLFSVPHGIGVLLGMHIANTFACRSGFMTEQTLRDVTAPIMTTINGVTLNSNALSCVTADAVIDQFKFDKKGDGLSVPLILIKTPGEMFFYRYQLGSTSEQLLTSVDSCIKEFVNWTA